MAHTNKLDQGVVLYLRGTASGTYTDKKGATRNIGTLGTSYVASDSFHIGAGQSIVITAQAVLGAVDANFALQVQRVDDSGLTWRWATVIIERMKDGDMGSAGVQTIVTGDLLEPDGATAADLVYATTNASLSGVARLICKASAGPAATDRVTLAVAVG